ncbi:MAG: Orotidine 5'-phosphate decarboxylase [Arenicellales bacterium IbO2]|nr:MAG: Orotidine 5'-phosphate decarboxylase [Arenicellales bacterium IbO2]
MIELYARARNHLMSDFITSLKTRWRDRRSLLCIGLDPDAELLPTSLRKHRMPLFAFNREIIDATARWACAFKPQIAHYAALGAEEQLAQTIAHIKKRHPGIPVILDAKRGDIGATAAMYAREIFERYGADAATLNPYLGFEALAPFFEYADKGAFVLCRTSNPGSGEFQALQSGGVPLAHHVAMRAAEMHGAHPNIGLVVGATWPGEIAAVRKLAGEMPLLIPGVGAQGGDLQRALAAGLNADGEGALINVSRAILYAGGDGDFAEAAARAAENFYREINSHRRIPPAGSQNSASGRSVG